VVNSLLFESPGNWGFFFFQAELTASGISLPILFSFPDVPLPAYNLSLSLTLPTKKSKNPAWN